MQGIGFLWETLIMGPMINSLVLLYTLLFSNFGLSILVFTVIIRLVTMPLFLRQIRQTRAMSALQPKMRELQKKYARDRQRLSQETMRLYREAGVSPLGCLGPLVVQFPILIGLFYGIRDILTATPDSLVGLSQRLYTWLPVVHRAIPVESSFLWLDLGLPDRTPILPILVGVSTWASQKMTTPPATDPRQASTSNMMLWMLPLMLAFFTFQFPSGLALYWVASNVIGIFIQYFITGWGPLFAPRRAPEAPAAAPPPVAKEMSGDGNPRDERQDRGGGHRAGSQRARRRKRRGGNRNPRPGKGGLPGDRG